MNEHFLTDIEIKQFKCFTDFKASGFKRVNLIGGKNNIGKTALMEAIYINVYSENINKLNTVICNIKFMRDSLNILDEYRQHKKRTELELFDSTPCYVSGSNIHKIDFKRIEADAVKTYCYKINGIEKKINGNDFNLIPTYTSIIFIDNFGLSDFELIDVYKVVQRFDKEEELNRHIREFDDSIENFKVIGDKPQCKTNGIYRDITEFGDGLKHYISIICALYTCKKSYLFIDEIDNGIYYEHFDRLWEIILTLSKETNCQVFATTHSKEMLESFARVAKKLDEQDISFTTLFKNKNGDIKAITRDYEMILGSIEDEREVR